MSHSIPPPETLLQEQDPEPTTPDGERRRGIYILPNLFTTGSLFAGFYAIVSAMNHHYISAAIAIYVALLFDGLDGRVARLIHAQSAFGAQYDSLSDMVSFGITPALVIYNWALQPLGVNGFGKLGWLSAFLFVACVALRLARFNTHTLKPELAKRYFFGLPCPAGAAFIASLVWVGALYHLNGLLISIIAAVLTVLTAAMMVSNILFRSFKDIDLKGKVPFTVLICMVAIFIAIAINPAHFLLLLFGLYVLSGPVGALWRRARKHNTAL